MHPTELSLLRMQWQTAFTAKDWALAALVGDSLQARDAMSDGRRDVPRAARGVAPRGGAYDPRDGARGARRRRSSRRRRRSTCCTRSSCAAERDSVVPRGLAAFPKSAELHALAATDLKARGKAEESLAAMQQAVALDSTLPQGVLDDRAGGVRPRPPGQRARVARPRAQARRGSGAGRAVRAREGERAAARGGADADARRLPPRAPLLHARRHRPPDAAVEVPARHRGAERVEDRAHRRAEADRPSRELRARPARRRDARRGAHGARRRRRRSRPTWRSSTSSTSASSRRSPRSRSACTATPPRPVRPPPSRPRTRRRRTRST